MKRQSIDSSNPLNGLHGAVVAQVKVHNSAGECTVRLTPEGTWAFSQADEGHYMLDAQGVVRKGADDEMAVASATVRPEGFRIYSERLVPELGVGEHNLVAVSHVVFPATPKPKGPR